MGASGFILGLFVAHLPLGGMGVVHAQPAGREGIALTDWPTIGGTADRRGIVSAGLAALEHPEWVVERDAMGEAVRFEPLSAPAVGDGFAYLLAERSGESVMVKVDLSIGEVAWSAPVPEPFFDSWASPSLDLQNGRVMFGADFYLIALRVEDGSEAFRIELESDAVNAGVAITTDRGPRDRAFYVDADSSGRSSRLYCVNVDPFDPVENPVQPGQVLWSVEVGGYGGTSPAYRDGRVYVSTSVRGGTGAGRVFAFDAGAMVAPEPIWTFTNVKETGFFGGPSVHGDASGTFVYAASFAFDGGLTSGNLVKIDAQSGSLVWSVDANRTDSTPIVLGDGRIVLSTGIAGFGSLPMVQVFAEQNLGAALVWDSMSATWEDRDGDGSVDLGEFLVLGGWNHQPIVARSTERTILYAGAIPVEGNLFGAYSDLYAIDLGCSEGDERRGPEGMEFLILGSFRGCGTSPVIAGGLLLSVGDGGLFSFLAPGLHYDTNNDGSVDIEDLYAWESMTGTRDVDGDGFVTAQDRERLIWFLRRNETADMSEGRR